eukprot:328410_1
MGNIGITIGIDHFEFNESKNAWCGKNVKMQVLNKNYKVIDIKKQIAKKLNKKTQNIQLYCFNGINDDKLENDEIKIHPKHETYYRVYDKIIFNIKYFYGNSKSDIIYNRKYKIITVNSFCCDKLIDIINKQVTTNNIVLNSLICQKLEKNQDDNVLILSYINTINTMLFMNIAEDIITLIKSYYTSQLNNLSLFEWIMYNNINMNDTLLLYKDFNKTYIEYKNIDIAETLIVYIRDVDKKYGRWAEIDCDDQKINQVQKEELTINVLDTVEQVKNKIMKQLNKEKIEPHTIRFNGHLLNKMDEAIINYGVEQDSVIQIHTVLLGS